VLVYDVNDNGNDNNFIIPPHHHPSFLMISSSTQRVTIKQVAREAGVSTQTISRVINDRPDVAPATRRRVLKVIERLGYQPNVVARSLSRRRSHTLGVVTAGLQYVGPSRTLNGITSMAEELGYTLLLKELPGFKTHDVTAILDYLLARQVDGIIWAVQEVGDNRKGFEQRLASLPAPIVFLTTKERPGFNIVSIDNYAGGRLATEHLLALGHRCIGHIAGPLNWWEARERKRGWEQTMAGAGLAAGAECWSEGVWSSASGEESMHKLLVRNPNLTAVFCANDQMALGALLYAHRHGIRVPDDLSVVGFDDILESAYFWPPLTTINHNQHDLGCRAVAEVVQAIESKNSHDEMPRPQNIIIQPTLIVRESSKPVGR